MALPKRQADRYENVDHARFDTAGKMSRAELVEMADLAYRRGDMAARAVWQGFAIERARHDELVESGKVMKAMLEPKPMSAPGPIVEAVGPEPWAGDPVYKKLKAKHAEAKAAVEAGRAGLDILALRNAEADASDAVKRRENEIRSELSAAGLFTEQDERVLDAQRSLAEKAAKLGELFG